jgi:hypothetical protein
LSLINLVYENGGDEDENSCKQAGENVVHEYAPAGRKMLGFIDDTRLPNVEDAK